MDVGKIELDKEKAPNFLGANFIFGTKASI